MNDLGRRLLRLEASVVAARPTEAGHTLIVVFDSETIEQATERTIADGKSLSTSAPVLTVTFVDADADINPQGD